MTVLSFGWPLNAVMLAALAVLIVCMVIVVEGVVGWMLDRR